MHPQINRSFIRGFDQLLLEKGVQPAVFYQQAQISPSRMANDDNLIPFYSELRLFDMAAKYFSEPDICLKLAERQSLSALGPAVSALQTQPNVYNALQAFQENLHLSVDGVQLELRATEHIALWMVNWADTGVGAIPYAQDHAAALMCILMKTLCGEQWKPRAVYFEHEELGGLSSFHRFFGAPIAFSSPYTAIAFDPACLPAPLKRPAIHHEMIAEPTTAPMPVIDLTQQITNVIALFIDNDECNIEKVADHLCMSKRTVQRRLHEDGTNFKDLVNQVRSEQAIKLLQNAHYSLAEIAAMLGYSQLSAFSRSFKRWHGVSPQIWRKQQTH